MTRQEIVDAAKEAYEKIDGIGSIGEVRALAKQVMRLIYWQAKLDLERELPPPPPVPPAEDQFS